jgi:hypothetical protein
MQGIENMADNTPKVETEDKPKNIQVSASLTPAELEAFQEVRFSQRHNKLSDAVKAALTEYVANHKA